MKIPSILAAYERLQRLGNRPQQGDPCTSDKSNINSEVETRINKLKSDATNYYRGNYRESNERELKKIDNVFGQLLDSNPTVEELEILNNIYQTTKRWYFPLVEVVEEFAKLVTLNSSGDEQEQSIWDHYNIGVLSCTKNKFNPSIFTSGFCKLVQKNHCWNSYTHAVDAFGDEYAELGAFTVICALLAPSTSKKFFQPFLNALTNLHKEDYSKWDLYKKIMFYEKPLRGGRDLTLSYFRILEANPTEEEWQIFQDVVNGWVNNCEGEFEQFTDFLRQFAKLVQAKPTKEQLTLCKRWISSLGTSSPPRFQAVERFVEVISSVGSWQSYQIEYAKFKEILKRVNFVDVKVANLISAGATPEHMSVVYDAVLLFMKSRHPSYIFDDFYYLIDEGASPLVLRVYKNGCSLIKDLKSTDEIRLIKLHCNSFTVHKSVPAFLRNINMAIEKGFITSLEELKRLLIEVSAHSALCTYIRNDDSKLRADVRKYISGIMIADQIPYPAKDEGGNIHPEYQRVFNETIQVNARAMDICHGFGVYTFEAKRLPSGELSLLARFGKDVARRIRYINAKDFELFPGRGFLISGIDPRKVFVPDKSDDLDPFRKYKEAWGELGEAIDDLPKTHFLFTRGFIGVSCPEIEYGLFDIDDKSINYTYVVFNDHHHNYLCNVAWLIPTSILREKLKGTTVSFEEYGDISHIGYSDKHKDINESELTPGHLISKARELQANIINPTSPSTYAGSLSNSYVPGSKPYHEWELSLVGAVRDYKGHTHKSFRLGTYQGLMSPELDEALIPLREAHDGVYKLTTRLQNLLDLFRISMALWHKGQTHGEPIFRSALSFLDELEAKQELVELGQDQVQVNPNSLRMLVEAYSWHNEGRKLEKTDRNFYPVLALGNALDNWTRPTSPFILDTYDMTLSIEEKQIQFPLDSNGLGEGEFQIWKELILPFARSILSDIRFYDRRDLGVA